MPIYEYHCNACGHEFEVIQKITDKPIRKCQNCGRLKAKRIISQTSFILKGSGWYVTDYASGRSPSNHDSGNHDKPSGNGSKSSDSGKADSKSETSGKKDSTPPSKEATT